MKRTSWFLVVALALTSIAAFTILPGCEDTDTAQGTAPPPVAADDHGEHAGHDHAAHMEAMGEDAPAEADQVVADAAADVDTIQQTKCPIMNAPINEQLYTVYQGKKVYFCCAGCEDTFNKDPEKYLSKLPQFSEEDGQ